MIVYLGQPLTPREEVIYLDAVLRSVVELSEELNKILAPKWRDDEVIARVMQTSVLNHLIEAEWLLWRTLYDQGQKYEWPRLPKTISDIRRELGWAV